MKNRYISDNYKDVAAKQHLDWVSVVGPLAPRFSEILTPQALGFLALLHREFAGARDVLLRCREERQLAIDEGHFPTFLKETEDVRQGDWVVDTLPEDLMHRSVEITGPVERKMIINALNSGAQVFMADFEDSCAPTWHNIIDGQLNLYDAVRRTITFTNAAGKAYQLCAQPATLMVRPRGWHLEEANIIIDGAPASASLVDFGLFFFHNATELISRNSGPYLYLPKLQSHLEARLWNQIFLMAQRVLGIPMGTIKATVLIEHILAAFEMDEILFELREHSAGLNCGRWDYIFSFIKTFRNHCAFVVPDRNDVTMERHFLRAYCDLLVQTCHRRGVHAMGGMAAQIPIKHDAEANALAMRKVRADKRREVIAGHDGTWVAHPGLVGVAQEIFAHGMKGEHQLDRMRPEALVRASDLLDPPTGSISREGVRNNVGVALEYLAQWLSGKGCVPIQHLMEDAATAEISRTQLWQWVRHGVTMTDGGVVDAGLVRQLLAEERTRLMTAHGTALTAQQLHDAASLLDALIITPTLTEFLTIPAYQKLLHLTHHEGGSDATEQTPQRDLAAQQSMAKC